MKNYTLLLINVFLLISAVTAQISELKYANVDDVIGIFNTQNEAFALSLLETRYDQTDVYQIAYLDENNTRLSFDIPDGSYFYDALSIGNKTHFVFTSSSSVRIITVEDDGYKTKEFALLSNDETSTNVSLSKIDDETDDLLLLTNTRILKDTFQTYTYYKYASNLDLQAQPTISLPLTKHITDVIPLEKGVAFLVSEKDLQTRKYGQKLQVYDENMGLVSSIDFVNDNDYIPLEIVTNNQELLVVGYYTFGSFFKASRIEGLFTKVINADGSSEEAIEFPFSSLKEKLKESAKGRGDFLMDGKSKIAIEHIAKTESGYKIITENYKRSSGTTAVEYFFSNNSSNDQMLTVYDFIVFDLDMKGDISNIDIYEKPEVNLDATGVISKSSSEIATNNQIKRLNLFPFINYKNDAIEFVNYIDQTPHFAKLDLNSGAITTGDRIILEPVIEEEENAATQEIISNSKFLTKLDNLGDKADAMDAKLEKMGNKIEYGVGKVDYKLQPYYKLTGFVALGNSNKVTYLMNRERFSIFYK